MKRLNITIPDELISELEAVPNKSRFITEALKEKLEREKKEKIIRLLAEGYIATKKEDKELNKEWEKTTLKDWK
ncbi:MAG: hypothetical protein FJ264_14840 [Planctomycetes bacterium]|nr:hypothetical protein [Planctomycetota bacterium]